MDNNAATRKDIDELKVDMVELKADIKNDISEVLDIMKSFMTQVDARFNSLELTVYELKQDMQKILNLLDSIEKATAKIDIQFTH